MTVRYICNNNFSKKVIEKLQSLNLSLEDSIELIQKMREDNGIMAGSFPLQILINANYEDSDIDIFFKSDTLVPTEIYTKFNPDQIVPRIIYRYNKFSNWLFEKFGIKSEWDSPEENNLQDNSQENSENILISRTYSLNDKLKINIIIVEVENLYTHFENFDMSFCNTLYDGNTLMYLPETLEMKGTINTVESFIGSYRYKFYEKHSKITYYHPVLIWNKTLEKHIPFMNYIEILENRIRKYQNRGMKITNLKILDDFYEKAGRRTSFG